MPLEKTFRDGRMPDFGPFNRGFAVNMAKYCATGTKPGLPAIY